MKPCILHTNRLIREDFRVSGVRHLVQIISTVFFGLKIAYDLRTLRLALDESHKHALQLHFASMCSENFWSSESLPLEISGLFCDN